MFKKLFAAFLLFSIIAACNTSKKQVTDTISVTPPAPQKKGVVFMESNKLMPVLEVAQKENKLVFVDFYTTWCLPCKLMDEDVFTNEDFGDFMNENFISYKVDAEKGNGPDLSIIYQVIAFPTLLFLDTEGNVLARKVGAAYHTELKNLATQAQLESQKGGE